jgi:tetratricopeptide (TPR) repeat protein
MGIASSTVKAQRSDDLDTLTQQATQLFQAGKYAEATDVAQRALALAERLFGPNHTKVATALNALATLYRAQGRYGEAEPLLKRALATSEKALGPDHPDVYSNGGRELS